MEGGYQANLFKDGVWEGGGGGEVEGCYQANIFKRETVMM